MFDLLCHKKLCWLGAIFLIALLVSGCDDVDGAPTPVEYAPETIVLPTPIEFATNTLTATPIATETPAPTGTRVALTTPKPPIPSLTPVVWKIRVSNVPLLQQQQTLTCEEAAASIASRGKFSEAQLVAVMPRHENPFLGIRGRTNAPTFGGIYDYGTYAQGLEKGLTKLGVRSEVLYKQSYENFQRAILGHLREDRPVVWWTTWRQTAQKPVNFKLSDGTLVKLTPYEHAVVIVGTNDTGFIVHDVYDGTVRFVSWADHKRASSYFDNMALVLR